MLAKLNVIYAQAKMWQLAKGIYNYRKQPGLDNI
jgi:hypothetical protein